MSIKELEWFSVFKSVSDTHSVDVPMASFKAVVISTVTGQIMLARCSDALCGLAKQECPEAWFEIWVPLVGYQFGQTWEVTWSNHFFCDAPLAQYCTLSLYVFSICHVSNCYLCRFQFYAQSRRDWVKVKTTETVLSHHSHAKPSEPGKEQRTAAGKKQPPLCFLLGYWYGVVQGGLVGCCQFMICFLIMLWSFFCLYTWSLVKIYQIYRKRQDVVQTPRKT